MDALDLIEIHFFLALKHPFPPKEDGEALKSVREGDSHIYPGCFHNEVNMQGVQVNLDNNLRSLL